jgi:hypothetical protein
MSPPPLPLPPIEKKTLVVDEKRTSTFVGRPNADVGLLRVDLGPASSEGAGRETDKSPQSTDGGYLSPSPSNAKKAKRLQSSKKTKSPKSTDSKSAAQSSKKDKHLDAATVSKICDPLTEEHVVLQTILRTTAVLLGNYLNRKAKAIHLWRLNAQLPDAGAHLNSVLARWAKFDPIPVGEVKADGLKLKKEAAEAALTALRHSVPSCCGASIVEKVHGSRSKVNGTASLAAAEWSAQGLAAGQATGRLGEDTAPSAETSGMVAYPLGQTGVTIKLLIASASSGGAQLPLSPDDQEAVSAITDRLASCIAKIDLAAKCAEKFHKIFTDKDAAGQIALGAASVALPSATGDSSDPGVAFLAETARSLLFSMCPRAEFRHGIFQTGMQTVDMVAEDGSCESVSSSEIPFSDALIPPEDGPITLSANAEGARGDSGDIQERTIGIVEANFEDPSTELKHGQENEALFLERTQCIQVLRGVQQWFGFALDKYLKADLLLKIREYPTSPSRKTPAASTRSDGSGRNESSAFLEDVMVGLHRVYPAASGLCISQITASTEGDAKADPAQPTILQRIGVVDDAANATTALKLQREGSHATAKASTGDLQGVSARREATWRMLIDIKSTSSSSGFQYDTDDFDLKKKWSGPADFFAEDEPFMLEVLESMDLKLRKLVPQSAVSCISGNIDLWLKRRLVVRATGVCLVDPESTTISSEVRDMLLQEETRTRQQQSKGTGGGKNKSKESLPTFQSHKMSAEGCIALGLPPASVDGDDGAECEVLIGVCRPPGLGHLRCIITALPEKGGGLYSPSLKASEVMGQVVDAASKVIAKAVSKGPCGTDKSEAVKKFFGHMLEAMQSKLVDISKVGLHEIKSYNEPPDMVIKVIHALFSMLSYKMRDFSTWKPLKQTFIRDNVWQKMIDLEPSLCASCDENAFAANELRPLGVETVFLKASMPIACVFEWALLCISLRTAFMQSSTQ